ncbi:MAG: hypothetical protein ACI4MH_04940 [Candidatus Coproplasma sp.]
MKTKAIKIFNLIFAVLVALFVTGYAFAWFVEDKRDSEQNFNGSSGTPYFESGDGLSVETAFEIKRPIQLYNLAWLQNLGKLKDISGTQKSFYFRLSDNLDMSGIVLPPIGNDEYPFIGVFNGNGKIISNLTVSTNKSVLTNSPLQSSSSYKFSNAVGMFGKTGTGSDVKNFILNNPTVEVTDTNSTFNDQTGTNGTSKAVGLALGYIENKASSIGIIGGVLSVQRTGYSTKNSIIGAMSSAAEEGSDLTGEGNTGEDGNTGYFIANNLKDVAVADLASDQILFKNVESSNYNMRQNKWLVSSNGVNGVPVGYNTTTQINSRWASEPDFDYSSKNKLGLGVFSFITGHNYNDTQSTGDISIRDSGALKSNDFTFNNGTTTSVVSYGSGTDVKYGGYVKNIDGSKITDGTTLEWNFRYRAASALLTSNSLNIIAEDSSTSLTQTNKSISGDSYSNLPTNALLFNVVEDSSRVFALHTNGSVKVSLILDEQTLVNRLRFKAAKEKNDASVSAYTTYEAFVEAGYTLSSDYNYIDGSYFFFKYDYDILYDTKSTVISSPDITRAVIGGGWTGDEIILNSNGLYALFGDSSVDIGYVEASGVAGASGGSGGAEETKTVSSIDFIYSGVTITQEAIGTEGSEGYVSAFSFIYNNALYTETGVRVSFSELSAVLYIGFIRKDETNYPLYSEYNGTDTISESVAGIAKVSANSSVSVVVAIDGATVTGLSWLSSGS